jgi:hypothetical protein
MRDDERCGVRLGRAYVQEVHVLAIDLGGELRDLVQAGLVFPPVVAGAPVLDQLDEVVLVDPVRPADPRKFVGPAGTGQPVAQFVEIGLRDVDAKGRCCAHTVSMRPV